MNSRISSLLADAQRDVLTAAGLTADPTGREQCARAAVNAAAEIINDPDSSAAEKLAARLCVSQALSITGQRRKIRDQSKSLSRSEGLDIG
jgi:hypothetical protein